MKIVIDIDDVLLDTTAAVRQYYLSMNPNADISESDYISDWKIYTDNKRDEWKRLIEEFNASDYLEKTLPVHGAVEALKKLKASGHSLATLSASTVDPQVMERKIALLKTIFGEDIFDEFYFIGVFESKKERLMKTGANVLIDDGLANVTNALDLGMTGIALKTKQNAKYIDWLADENTSGQITPSFWTYDKDKLKNAKIANDWQQVLKIIESKK